MTMRWQERRVEDELLKRELLLRLRAEHSNARGRIGPATDHFRRRIRRLLLRHPIFAFRYYQLAIDLGLGRFGGPERDGLGRSRGGASAAVVPQTDLDLGIAEGAAPDFARAVPMMNAHPKTAIKAAVPRRGARRRRKQWTQRLEVKPGFVQRRCESGFGSLAAGARWVRLLMYTRVVRVQRRCMSGIAGLVVGLRRQRR